jgi:cytoplasmic iron level regulating protein YaaA (DUF328/UPF0246 family)
VTPKARTRPAIYAFAGDVYQGFDAATLTKDDIAFAQKHIGILSGLYGLLRPLDAIAPYRLEMGTRVDTERGKDLYEFWRPTVAARVNAVTAKMKKPVVVNLASMEYWGAVDEKARIADTFGIDQDALSLSGQFLNQAFAGLLKTTGETRCVYKPS